MTPLLGDVVRDKVSGFEGELIGRAEYLYEPPQVLVAARTGNGAADSRWLPESRVELAPPGGTGFHG